MSSGEAGSPTLDALVFVMLRCLRAFSPYSHENSMLGEVLSREGSPNSAELWKASVAWGVRELGLGYEISWPEGEEWLHGTVGELAKKLLYT